MEVLARKELNRIRLGNALALLMALVVLLGALTFLPHTSNIGRLALIGRIFISILTLLVTVFQLASRLSRSKVILVQRGNDFTVITNSLHDGFKLRFLRDILTDAISPLSDVQRKQWELLDTEGFHPVFVLVNVRKTLIITICCLIFDEVIFYDHKQRWDYYDCTKTSDPTFPIRGTSPFKTDSVIPDFEGTTAGK